MEKKVPPPRQCTSLPSSRRNSLDDIPSTINHPKSTPHTPAPSQSSSLADISAQAAIMQESLEASMILSDSTVSLNSLDINDGSDIRISEQLKENSVPKEHKSILRHRNYNSEKLIRRVSLQEAANFVKKYDKIDSHL